jgi:hypothetical protein
MTTSALAESRVPSRCVRQVAVHLDHELGTSRDGLGHAVHVGAAESLLARPVRDGHPVLAILQGQPVGDLAGAVGRVVVGHQQPQAG